GADGLPPDEPVSYAPDQTTTALETSTGASKGKVTAWAFWDWGSQPWNTVITTFVFAVYITSDSFGSTNHTSQMLALSTAVAGFFVAALAPVLGQNSARSGRTVRNLRWQTWVLAALAASLFLVKPDPDYLVDRKSVV